MLEKVEIDAALGRSNTIFVDVRSPHEFQGGTIPGAVNIPILNNEERVEIGIIYKQQGTEEAKIRGLEIVAPKLPVIYKELRELQNNENQTLTIFCARGGLRSTTFANFFKTMGLSIQQLQGGFKAYRNYVLDYQEKIAEHHQFIVLHGFTGVGKTEILNQLTSRKIPCIDLEALASNKGSVFGEAIDQENKLTQKNFENALINQLIMIKEKYVVVESESKRLGHISIPNEIFDAMKAGKHVLISTSLEERVSRLVEDYVNIPTDHEELLVRGIQLLKKRIGNEKVNRYIQWVKEEKFEFIAMELITDYYDPLYQHSLEKYNYDLRVNYDKIEEAVEAIDIYYKEIEGKTN